MLLTKPVQCIFMRNITIEALTNTPIEELNVEIVERKGIGHPDTICDSIMNEVSVELSKSYIKEFGAVMHHNVDKSLLVAGGAEHAFGGGRITEPMLLIFGDRATFEVGGKEIPVVDIAVNSAKKWLRENLRVDPDEHMRYQVELKKGSSELTDIFRRKGKVLGANDTSATVGYAPLTRTEQLVYKMENHLNSRSTKRKFPELGEDIKVMGVRLHHEIHLTIAAPLVEKYVRNEADYFRKKEEIYDEMFRFAREASNLKTHIYYNTLDKRGRGINGVYLSVLGTSAEDADCGQVGRGNRVNGIIPLNRPVSAEAAAGKNPVSHIGKIYNVLGHKIAREVYEEVPGIEEVYIWLCSQIGKPIDQPKIAAAQIIMKKKEDSLIEISKEVREIMDSELAHINKLCNDLAMGKIKIC
jgi:S-adenosylmethionine synthetase